jgi:hypothetical protein
MTITHRVEKSWKLPSSTPVPTGLAALLPWLRYEGKLEEGSGRPPFGGGVLNWGRLEERDPTVPWLAGCSFMGMFLIRSSLCEQKEEPWRESPLPHSVSQVICQVFRWRWLDKTGVLGLTRLKKGIQRLAWQCRVINEGQPCCRVTVSGSVAGRGCGPCQQSMGTTC